MKQILQNLRTGKTEILDIPKPQIKPGQVLIRTYRSLISAGTERMLIDFGKAGLINKARQQPEKVRMVLDKIKSDGLLATFDAVKNKLDTPLPMGYCNVGEVLEIASDVTEFSVGDLVVSNGYHAELVVVPKNLCVKLPTNVDIESAAFAVLGAISLQGIRLLQPTLGETIAVTGMGLLGLLAVQLLRANGCKVLALDFDTARLELAKQFGAETVDLNQQDPVNIAENFTQGRGIDGVLITASTKSNDPVHQAAQMCRKRGRIVLVGVTGLELSRADFYEKELSFQVSCSYGPGRYDKNYEERGQDYPFAYVRWTEQRNIEAVLEMMARNALDVKPFISHHFSLEQAADAYQLISEKKPSLGIILEYNSPEIVSHEKLKIPTIKISTPKHSAETSEKIKIGFIGSGNYATQILIPAFSKNSATLFGVASQTGTSAVHVARKFGIKNVTTNTQELLQNPDVNTIVITTRHDSHAELTCQALAAGKHVFVEKPLALNHSELATIQTAYETAKANDSTKLLMVGFNRRFSPHVTQMKSLLKNITEPKTIIITVNPGFIPTDHWTQHKSVGGGRIAGEACHFIDLMRHLVGQPIIEYKTTKMGKINNINTSDDKATITLAFADGSFGSIHYFSNGAKSFPKERIEIFCGGKILQLNNFRKLTGYGWKNFNKMNLWRQDKGQVDCVKHFITAIQNQDQSPIPFSELIEVAKNTIDIAEVI